MGRLFCHFADDGRRSRKASAAWGGRMPSDACGLGIRMDVVGLIRERWFVWFGKVLP